MSGDAGWLITACVSTHLSYLIAHKYEPFFAVTLKKIDLQRDLNDYISL
jgi:hypothetical protein